MFPCKFCKAEFASISELKCHLTGRHLGWFPYQCSICYLLYDSSLEAQDHINQKHPEGTLATIIFNPNPQMEVILDQWIFEAGKSCSNLNRTTEENSDFPPELFEPQRNPRDVHLDIKTEDPELFLQSSLEQNQVPVPFGKEFLSEAFVAPSHSSHLGTHKLFCSTILCKICNTRIHIRASRVGHVIRNHWKGPNLLTCGYCDFAIADFTQRHIIVKHCLHEHQMPPKIRDDEQVQRSREYICQLVAKCFGDIPNPTTTVQCRVCKRTLKKDSYQSKMIHIMQKHLKENLMHCAYCDPPFKYFGRQYELEKHIRMRHKGKPVKILEPGMFLAKMMKKCFNSHETGASCSKNSDPTVIGYYDSEQIYFGKRTPARRNKRSVILQRVKSEKRSRNESRTSSREGSKIEYIDLSKIKEADDNDVV